MELLISLKARILPREICEITSEVIYKLYSSLAWSCAKVLPCIQTTLLAFPFKDMDSLMSGTKASPLIMSNKHLDVEFSKLLVTSSIGFSLAMACGLILATL